MLLINIYMGVSVDWPLSMLCVCACVCVCVISNHSTSKKQNYVSDLSKLDTLLHKHIAISSSTEVSRLNMFRSIILLVKITYQMWHHHPFRQRNKTTKRAVGLQGWRWQVWGWNKIWKRRVGNKIGLHKIWD